MGGTSTTEPDGDFDNPYASPKATRVDPWSDGPPEALALRQAHRREEAYAKALAIANLIYFILFGSWACNLVWILILYGDRRT